MSKAKGTKRKRSTLPRLSILAYSRADLLRFSEAVERAISLVNDLEGQVAALTAAVAALEAGALRRARTRKGGDNGAT